jgi:hypothetical protein
MTIRPRPNVRARVAPRAEPQMLGLERLVALVALAAALALALARSA